MAHGLLRKLFETFERHSCTADLVSTSEASISVALDSSCDAGALLHDLQRLGEVEVENGKAIICLVGKDIRGRVGIAASVFHAVAAAGVNVHMISQGASEINISFVVEENDVPKVVQVLHKRFFEGTGSRRIGACGFAKAKLRVLPFPKQERSHQEVG